MFSLLTLKRSIESIEIRKLEKILNYIGANASNNNNQAAKRMRSQEEGDLGSNTFIAALFSLNMP